MFCCGSRNTAFSPDIPISCKEPPRGESKPKECLAEDSGKHGPKASSANTGGSAEARASSPHHAAGHTANVKAGSWGHLGFPTVCLRDFGQVTQNPQALFPLHEEWILLSAASCAWNIYVHLVPCPDT